MTDQEYDRLMATYREKFGEDAPYNFEDPEEHAERVRQALADGVPIPEDDDISEGDLV